jgi:hypothetical protein
VLKEYTGPSLFVCLFVFAFLCHVKISGVVSKCANVRGPLSKFVDWRRYAAVMQREVVTVMPSCNGGGNVIVA